jgi:hypothetical protein
LNPILFSSLAILTFLLLALLLALPLRRRPAVSQAS